MPRQPRQFLPGAIYHVYCHVARGELVLDGDFEAVNFVETLHEVRDLDGSAQPSPSADDRRIRLEVCGWHYCEHQSGAYVLPASLFGNLT